MAAAAAEAGLPDASRLVAHAEIERAKQERKSSTAARFEPAIILGSICAA